MAGPSATVTRTNILAGPGAIYSGAVGAVEPTDAAVNTTPQASAWTDAGATDDGLTITVNQEFFEIEIDQVADVVGRRLTGRSVQVSTNLAEGTLENLALAVNDSVPASGSGYKSLSLVPGQAAMVPTERAILVDGWAPGTNKRRRLIARRVLSIENVESAYKKDDKYMIPVTFGAHYVDATTSPVKWIDET
jgi:hypothetical protein